MGPERQGVGNPSFCLLTSGSFHHICNSTCWTYLMFSGGHHHDSGSKVMAYETGAQDTPAGVGWHDYVLRKVRLISKQCDRVRSFLVEHDESWPMWPRCSCLRAAIGYLGRVVYWLGHVDIKHNLTLHMLQQWMAENDCNKIQVHNLG